MKMTERPPAFERLQDLDPLLLADRELPDLRRRIHRQPVLLADFGDPILGCPPVEPAGVAEHHVLGHRERRHQAKMLVDHPDTAGKGLTRRADPHDLAGQ